MVLFEEELEGTDLMDGEEQPPTKKPKLVLSAGLNVDVFLKWCTSNGTKSPKLKFDRLQGCGMGNGMIALEDIEAGEDIVEVPLDLLINVPTIKRYFYFRFRPRKFVGQRLASIGSQQQEKSYATYAR